MEHRPEEVLSRWLDRLERRFRRLARHPFAVDLTLAIAISALSAVGLASQNRLRADTLVFCALLCAPLLLPRHRLQLRFALTVLVAFVQWLVSAPQLADVTVLIALYLVALDGRLLEVALAGAVVELGAIVAAIRWSPSEPAKVWVGLTGLATAAGVLGVTVRQRRALLVSLREEAATLEVERDQEGRIGAAAERARIAREMHDIVAHNLSVIVALADGAAYTMDSSPARARDATERVSVIGRQAMLEMRRLLGVLGDDSAHGPLAPQPGLDRLDALVAQVQAAGIPVTIDLDGDPAQLPQGVQLTVFRVAQEALTNTLKHAVRPASAHLDLHCDPHAVELVVSDTGGFVPSDWIVADGRGLRGMRERAAACGGWLEAGPAPSGGWRVSLRLRPDAELLLL